MDTRKFLLPLLAAWAFSAAAQVSAAPMLQVNSAGILTGAHNVNVAGTLYNMKFADGSCNSLFSNCSTSAFTFSDEATAFAAAQALIEQVFVDGPLGLFDSAPSLTLDCGSPSFCYTYIPYGRSEHLALISYTFNGPGEDDYQNGRIGADFIVQGVAFANYALFELATPAASVPEPSSIVLIGLALAGLAFKRHRKA